MARYVVEFKTADGEALAISMPLEKARVRASVPLIQNSYASPASVEALMVRHSA